MSRPASSAGDNNRGHHYHHHPSTATKSQRRHGHVDMTAGPQPQHNQPPLHPPSPRKSRAARSSAPASPLTSSFPASSPKRPSTARHSHTGHLQEDVPAKSRPTSVDGAAGRQSYERSLPPAPYGQRQPLYQYIRPNKDCVLSLSPSSAPPSNTAFSPSVSPSGSRSASLDKPRSTSGGSRRPLSTSTAASAISSVPRSSIDTARAVSPSPRPPGSRSRRQSNFLDISYHEGMSTDDVRLPGPESLTPANAARIGFGSASLGHRPNNNGSVSGQMEQMMMLANTTSGGGGTLETASGRYRYVDGRKDKKDKKKAGWKRLSAGFKSLVGR